MPLWPDSAMTDPQPHQGQIAGRRWDPQQYLKFGDHRLRPALELLGRVPLEAPKVVYDLGCGAGAVTRLIAAGWPRARVYGLDSSRDMLTKAAGESGTVQWLEADIGTWTPEERPDLVYANASLHWLEDHDQLFGRLVGFLRPGGCLAVQMPLSWGAPSHRLMRQTLADGGPDGKALGSAQLRQGMARQWVQTAREYYELLADRCSKLDIWETEYLQVLEGDDPVLEWVKSTGLRPVLNGLADQERAVFLAEYARRLRQAYPVGADGRTLYPFRRLFIVGLV